MRALVALTLTGVMCAACAPRTTSVDLNAALRERTGHTIKPADGAALPPGVTLEDGLTADEAVAIALWNSPSFQLVLADLGLARADLVEAGLLRNPVLSLLFPWGPKQFEWTVQFPFEVLWQRPRRVAAAQLNLESVSQRLVWDGLTLVADVRGAFADTLIAERRLALAGESAILTRRVADLTESRLRAGDISELEARGARSDAARVDVLRKAAEYDRDLAGLTLTGVIGLDPAALPIRMISGELSSCVTNDNLFQEALASRPDIRAAELAIEAAGARARWEHSRIITLIGIIDGNGQGSEGAEAGSVSAASCRSFQGIRAGSAAPRLSSSAPADATRPCARRWALMCARRRFAYGRPRPPSMAGVPTSCRRSRSNSARPRARIRPAKHHSSPSWMSAGG